MVCRSTTAACPPEAAYIELVPCHDSYLTLNNAIDERYPDKEPVPGLLCSSIYIL